MNEAHLHLILNHFPIIVPMIGFILLLVGLFKSSDLLQKTALVVLIFGAISAFPASFSGERAEEMLENVAGFDKTIMHEHEEAAEVFSLMSYALALLSLVTLFAKNRKMPLAKWLMGAVVVLTLVSFYFAQQAGTTGGEIRHTEIRSDFVPTAE